MRRAIDTERAPDVRSIVRRYLQSNGFDGLYSIDCGCESGDLMPCCESSDACMPGVKVPCDPATCPADGDCEYHIGPRR